MNAGKWPDSYDSLNHRSDCAALLEAELGEPLRRYRTGWSRWACPLHGGRGPNLAACTECWKCHVCGAGGDALSFIMQYHHMDFKTALRYLGGESQIGPVRKKVPPQTLPPEPSKPIDHEALEDITRRAEAKLWSGDGRGLDYLKQRGLADEVIRQARLGYIPPDRPAYWVHGLKVFPGILIPSTYQGRVEFLQFRHIWARGKGDRYRSLGGAGGTLFLGDQLRPFEAIHLFEGAFNALIAQQLGANAAALSSAANTLAPRWYAKFATAPKVYLCGDADVAGQTFMEKHRALGPEFQAWLAPEMDLNALYLQSPQEARAVLGRADYRAQMAALREILFRP